MSWMAWRTSQMNKSCLTYEWVMSGTQKTHISYLDDSCVTHTSDAQMSHVAHTKDSRLTPQRVMSHVWMSHVWHTNNSCLIFGWVMCHTHEWRTNDSCRTQTRLTSHMWMSQVCHMHIHELHTATHCHTCTRVWMSHVLRGGGLGSSTIFKKFNETYAPS